MDLPLPGSADEEPPHPYPDSCASAQSCTSVWPPHHQYLRPHSASSTSQCHTLSESSKEDSEEGLPRGPGLSSGGEEGADRKDRGKGDEYVDEEDTSGSSSSGNPEPSNKAQGAAGIRWRARQGHQAANPARYSTQVVHCSYLTIFENIQRAYDHAPLWGR